MLDLQTLTQALAPIAEIGKGERTFKMEGVSITLRPLLPSEELQAQRFGLEKAKGDSPSEEGDSYTIVDYMICVRNEILAYAIVQVNGLDLRNETYIATGEVTDTGKPVRVAKNVALRGMIEKWSRTVVTAAYEQYTSLLSDVEAKANQLVEYAPADLEAEIQRVQSRLDSLNEERGRRAKGDANFTAEQMDTLQKAGESFDRVVQAARDIPPPNFPPPPAKTVVPPSGAPWESVGEVAPVQTAPVVPERDDRLSDVTSSFGDIEDDRVREEEAARILAARRKLQAESQRPPHLRGASPLEITGGTREVSPEKLAQLGIQAPQYGNDLSEEAALRRLQQRQESPEVLSNRGRARPGEVAVNTPPSSNQGRNPRFTPPR